MLEVPYGSIFQLWSKERVELGQNCNQPIEIAANQTGHQNGGDNSPAGTVQVEPGHQEADEATEFIDHIMIAARALYFFYTIVNEILFASFFILSACAIIYHQVINKSPLDGYLSPQTLLFVDLSLYSVNSK